MPRNTAVQEGRYFDALGSPSPTVFSSDGPNSTRIVASASMVGDRAARSCSALSCTPPGPRFIPSGVWMQANARFFVCGSTPRSEVAGTQPCSPAYRWPRPLTWGFDDLPRQRLGLMGARCRLDVFELRLELAEQRLELAELRHCAPAPSKPHPHLRTHPHVRVRVPARAPPFRGIIPGIRICVSIPVLLLSVLEID